MHITSMFSAEKIQSSFALTYPLWALLYIHAKTSEQKLAPMTILLRRNLLAFSTSLEPRLGQGDY
jgi:hypothetical protein